MQTYSTNHSLFYFLIVLTTSIGSALVIIGCGAETATQPDVTPSATWTLREDLRISEESDYFLGTVTGIAVRADGAILALDGEEYHVKVISPEGELLRTVGRKGEGPGEFQGPQQLALARGDSLYVLDGGRRLQVFAPATYEPSRTIRLPGGPEGRRYPAQLAVLPGEGFLLTYEAPPALGGADPILRLMGAGGAARRDTMLRGPGQIQVVAQQAVWRVDKPFARRSSLAQGPGGRLYHGTTDSLALTISDASGKVRGHWVQPTPPRPVTDVDLKTFIDAHVDEAVAMFGAPIRAAAREALREALEDADRPQTHPAWYDLLADDRGQLWIRRDPEYVETATWWVLSASGAPVAQFNLPGPVQLEVIRDGYAYGRVGDMDTRPAVIRYRIEKPT